MKLKLFISLTLSIVLLLSIFSCDLFDYHPLHNRAYMMGGKEINRSVTCVSDTVIFVFLGDTHNDYTITKQLVKHINERKDNIDFVIHAGDFTDFAHRKEYKKFHDIFSKLEISYIVLPGNHDLLNYGRFNFREMFGVTNFSFVARLPYPADDLRFICLNTNMLCGNEYDDFVDYALACNEWSHEFRNIFVMHSPPRSEQFKDEATLKRFGDVLNNFSGPVMFCLHGHEHSYSQNDFYDNGIMFYGCDNIEKRTYLLFTITENGYTYERVKF